MRKRIFSILLVLMILSSAFTFADDNADTGSGDTNNALKDKGFYRGSEYMYKVSVYVGLSDEADKNDNLNVGWIKIGYDPIFIKPSSFTLPSNVLGSNGNKIEYQQGKPLSPIQINEYITDNPPPIPITNGGNINSVKSYFGDTATLNMLLNNYASQFGIPKESLIANITFTIEGKTKKYPAKDILPVKVDDVYQNKVPWLIVYEPVIVSYLKDKTTILAFTATEYALAQKLGYFNFKSGSDGQYIAGMTHSDLPNSIFLEESWFGFPVTSALPDNVYWSDDRIIAGGGWGMRMLKANSVDVVENDTQYDYEYRVDTDVITSVRVFANTDITPDDRHLSEEAYRNPKINTATITMTANGYSKSAEVVIPRGGSQLVWLKWHTPLKPGIVEIDVSVSGNNGAKIDGTSRSAKLIGKVVDLSENPPPNPTANDKNDNFVIPNIPEKADKSTASWGIYNCHWIPNWIWHPKWEWRSSWSWISTETGGFWIDSGYWVDNGHWVDEGRWDYGYTNYSASLSASVNLSPDIKVPTSDADTIKSGYGVNAKVESRVTTNAPSSHLTYAQNVIAYFPEFQYQNFWRVLEKIGSGSFEFEKNIYSTYNNRVHFTPVWYPDESYLVYAELIDLWTPDGMLRLNLTDDVMIQGNLYEDWHIGPK